MKHTFGYLIDCPLQKGVEYRITQFLQDNFSFCVIEEDDKSQRLWLESRIISIVSLCQECGLSGSWLGIHSPKEKIRKGGLWQVNELYKESFFEGNWIF